MADWPESLPRYPLYDGLAIEHPNNLIASPMDQGPPKVRRKTTANRTKVTCAWDLTHEQLLVLIDFLDVTTAQGALPFNWWHPVFKAPCMARFDPERMPSYVAVSGDSWRVSASILILP